MQIGATMTGKGCEYQHADAGVRTMTYEHGTNAWCLIISDWALLALLARGAAQTAQMFELQCVINECHSPGFGCTLNDVLIDHLQQLRPVQCLGSPPCTKARLCYQAKRYRLFCVQSGKFGMSVVLKLAFVIIVELKRVTSSLCQTDAYAGLVSQSWW